MTPPTPQEAEIAGVAASLNPEQCAALLGAIECKDGWYLNFGKPVRNRLLAMNSKLTPLGLAVRAHLQRAQGER